MTVLLWLSRSSNAGNDRISFRNLSIYDMNINSLSSSYNDASSSSLISNLSLQTLPSVPSLQSIPPDNLKLAVSHICVSSFTPVKSQSITCLASADHGNLIYAASGHQINVFHGNSYNQLDSFNGHDSASGYVKSITFCNGKVFTAHQDCKIRVWMITVNYRHKLSTTLPTVNDYLRRCISPTNYVSVRRHKKCLWIEHADAVTALAVNRGLIFSVSWDKTLKIWRATDNRCIESITAHQDAINTITISSDGIVYTGSADMLIKVWEKPAGKKEHALRATLEKHKSAVNALALNDDGSVLFSGACDRSILVWEREDSSNYMVVTGALRGHNKAILCLINVSDLLLSGSADRTVRMWKRGSEGKFFCLGILEGHNKPVKALVAVGEDESNDVVSVWSGSLDGEVKVWRLSFSNLNSPLKL